MKIIFKYILTNVKERKVRTAVMLLSIILSTVLLFVSFSIGESYENAQRKMTRGMSGTASMQPELDIVTFLSAGAMGIAVTLVSSVVPIIKTRNMILVEDIKFE